MICTRSLPDTTTTQLFEVPPPDRGNSSGYLFHPLPHDPPPVNWSVNKVNKILHGDEQNMDHLLDTHKCYSRCHASFRCCSRRCARCTRRGRRTRPKPAMYSYTFMPGAFVPRYGSAACAVASCYYYGTDAGPTAPSPRTAPPTCFLLCSAFPACPSRGPRHRATAPPRHLATSLRPIRTNPNSPTPLQEMTQRDASAPRQAKRRGSKQTKVNVKVVVVV